VKLHQDSTTDKRHSATATTTLTTLPVAGAASRNGLTSTDTMEGRSHSLRLPLPTPRRPTYQRTASSSSEASHASNGSHRSHGSEDQFVLSPSHTPAHENAPPRVMISRFATDSAVARHGLLLGKGTSLSTRVSLRQIRWRIRTASSPFRYMSLYCSKLNMPASPLLAWQ
jgi:hypothetical protein